MPLFGRRFALPGYERSRLKLGNGSVVGLQSMCGDAEIHDTMMSITYAGFCIVQGRNGGLAINFQKMDVDHSGCKLTG